VGSKFKVILGIDDGIALRVADGFKDATSDGILVGASVGSKLGAILGIDDGMTLGVTEGFKDATSVGF